jgi:hypothetical protein
MTSDRTVLDFINGFVDSEREKIVLQASRPAYILQEERYAFWYPHAHPSSGKKKQRTSTASANAPQTADEKNVEGKAFINPGRRQILRRLTKATRHAFKEALENIATMFGEGDRCPHRVLIHCGGLEQLNFIRSYLEKTGLWDKRLCRQCTRGP